MIVVLVIETVWPDEMLVLFRFKSEPVVLTSPCNTHVVPAEVVHKRKCVAVPVPDAVADAIALKVNTPPVTVPKVAEQGNVASNVPVAAAPTLSGLVPE